MRKELKYETEYETEDLFDEKYSKKYFDGIEKEIIDFIDLIKNIISKPENENLFIEYKTDMISITIKDDKSSEEIILIIAQDFIQFISYQNAHHNFTFSYTDVFDLLKDDLLLAYIKNSNSKITISKNEIYKFLPHLKRNTVIKNILNNEQNK
jgi:hypothetical protein